MNSFAELQPFDQFNQELQAQVHPPDWRNPEAKGRYNLVVIGAGTAGLVAAAGAAALGAKVALVERASMGGDCLNTGCVPSKALIRCARAAADVRGAGRFGVQPEGVVSVDFAAVMERMRRLRASLSHHDSAARFAQLGVDVFLGEARFTSADSVEVCGQRLQFSRALIATGARARTPQVAGLKEAGYLTNDSIFSLTALPARLTVIGGGPLGCELAQTFMRLGSQVTLIISGPRIMPRDDPEAAGIVEAAMEREGLEILRDTEVLGAQAEGAEKVLSVKGREGKRQLRSDEVLVAIGRVPNVEHLGLEAAGVVYDVAKGVRVNDFLQSSNRRIYAAGDVASGHKFTHMADAMARIVLRNALFFGRRRVSALAVPWCTYTDPEVAHVGLDAEQARTRGLEVQTITIPLSQVDRAVLDGEEAGYFRVHLKRGSDRILGATLVSRHAGESISMITAMMTAGKGLALLAETIHPYPTQAEVIKRAADAYNKSRLTPAAGALLKKVLSWRR